MKHLINYNESFWDNTDNKTIQIFQDIFADIIDNYKMSFVIENTYDENRQPIRTLRLDFREEECYIKNSIHDRSKFWSDLNTSFERLNDEYENIDTSYDSVASHERFCIRISNLPNL